MLKDDEDQRKECKSHNKTFWFQVQEEDKN